LSASAEVATAGVAREKILTGKGLRSRTRTLVISALALIVLCGIGFRAVNLGAEGLSEDELNKLRAVEDYRAHGLTAANGEHPMLMKALLTVSVVVAERWNASALASQHPSRRISTETALRLPSVIFGALTSLLIFLVVSELFGTEIALITAALWAIDPTAISFNRIAKEDTFLLFFFLLANVFWLRSQRAAESGRSSPLPFYWATAASFGAMLASKYMPHLLAISVSYYYIFQGVKSTRWRVGWRRWLIFFAVMGAAFLLCNPTVLLPGTWYEMKLFAGEHRIGHDSYEFMGKLYRNQFTLWLKGVPWYFYYVFMGIKLPLPILAAFIVGLPVLFLKRLGDGRFFILFWLMYWFLPFPVLGGKFTRYFTMALPVVLITAAIGIHCISRSLTSILKSFLDHKRVGSYTHAMVTMLMLAFPVIASASVSPHYRLYTNLLGGGMERAGSYFPHDEFYDASVRDAVFEIAGRARVGARLASESPALTAYYAQVAGRPDLVSLSLSDRDALRQLEVGDFVISARGRRYFSNEAVNRILQQRGAPVANISLGKIPSINVYMLDQISLAEISKFLNQSQ
jgi:hypothetical protein